VLTVLKYESLKLLEASGNAQDCLTFSLVTWDIVCNKMPIVVGFLYMSGIFTDYGKRMNEMDVVCSTYGGEERRIQGFGWKT
jgi:hypothetical protein